jgi:hypothetical protein
VVAVLGPAEFSRAATRLTPHLRRRGHSKVTINVLLARISLVAASGGIRHLSFMESPEFKHVATREDHSLCVSVSVPFPIIVTPEELIRAFRGAAGGGDAAAEARAAHLDRLLSEMLLTVILRFCDRHGFQLRDLAAAYRWNRSRGGPPIPDIESHLA